MTEQTQDTGLTINDIQLAVQIIDVASIRGAIRGKEMAAVGILRGRFEAFLIANGSKSKVTEEEPAES